MHSFLWTSLRPVCPPARLPRLREDQKHEAAQGEAEALKVEAEKVSGLEAASAELQSKVQLGSSA